MDPMVSRSSSETDSSPSSLPIPRKVCIVCSTSSLESNSGHELNMFIVDLNSAGGGASGDELDLAPTVRLVGLFFRTAGFCVVGSTLYVFEGCERDGDNRCKSVYIYELPSNVSNLKLEKSTLGEPACCMNDIKIYPFATPTPDGKKILVSSSRIESLAPDRFNFELFDPAVPKCQTLPKLLIVLRPWESPISVCWIRMFTFSSESVLFIQTDRGLYTLDLQLQRDWERLHHFRGATYMKFPFVVIGDDVCLSPYGAYDIDVHGIRASENAFSRWSYYFPELWSFSDSSPIRGLSNRIILLDVMNPRDCKFCIFKSGTETIDVEMIPHLILHVYQCDLIECRKELEKNRRLEKIRADRDTWDRTWSVFKLPHTFKVKSLKFRLRPDLSHGFYIRTASSIPADTILAAEPRQEGRKAGSKRRKAWNRTWPIFKLPHAFDMHSASSFLLLRRLPEGRKAGRKRSMV